MIDFSMICITEGLIIYPNPASETLWIDSGEEMDLLEIRDLLGRSVYEKHSSEIPL